MGEKQGERNLKISRGMIIVMKENRSRGLFRGGTTSGCDPSEAYFRTDNYVHM